MKKNKVKLLLFFVSVAFIAFSCRKEKGIDDSVFGRASVTINMKGVGTNAHTYGKASLQAAVGKVTAASKVQRKDFTFDGLEYTATLREVGKSGSLNLQASLGRPVVPFAVGGGTTPVPLEEGTAYTVRIYDGDGTLVEERDFVQGDPSNDYNFDLDGGQTYTFKTFAYGDATATGADKDPLWAEQSLLVHAKGTNVVDIVLSHKLTEVTVVFDAGEGRTISAINDGGAQSAVSPNYDYTFDELTGAVVFTDPAADAHINFPAQDPGQIWTSDATMLAVENTTEGVIELKGVVINGTLGEVLTEDWALRAGVQYVLDIKLKAELENTVTVTMDVTTDGGPSAGDKVVIYTRPLGSTDDNDFVPVDGNPFVVDENGQVVLEVEPGLNGIELKVEPDFSDVIGNLGAFDFFTPSTLIPVPDFNDITTSVELPSTNGYMLLGNDPSTSTTARLANGNLGVYNNPTIFGNNTESSMQELTFQVKVKPMSKGGPIHPAIGGTATMYGANWGNPDAEGFGFEYHAQNNDTFGWRFRFGQVVVGVDGAEGNMSVGNEWVTLTVVIRAEGGERRMYVFQDGVRKNNLIRPNIAPTTGYAVLGPVQTAVTTGDLIFGKATNQGNGQMTNYIKDFRIYTRALTDQEVIDIACNDFVSPEDVAADPYLIGYWPMNDGYLGTFKNYSAYAGAAGKDMEIDDPKDLTEVARKCDQEGTTTTVQGVQKVWKESEGSTKDATNHFWE